MAINLSIQPSKQINVELSRAVVGVDPSGQFTGQEKTSLLANVANLQTGLANIAAPNLAPINSRIANVEQAVANIAIPNLTPLTNRVANVESGLAGITIPNISPLTDRVAALETSVGGIVVPNISPLTSRVTTVENTVVAIQTKNTQQDGAISSLQSAVAQLETGTDATLPLADGTNAGLMSPAQFTKLSGIAAGATVNATDAQLRDRTTHTGTQPISTIAGLQTALDGKATLISGKLDPSQVPDIALQQYLGAAASEAAMLTLVGQLGDWCTRSDTGTDWRIVGNPATIAGWLQTAYPSAPVVSVAGKAGAVTLTKADVGLGNVDNTSDANKPVSTAQATAIGAKMDATLPALQVVVDSGTPAQKAAFQSSVSGDVIPRFRVPPAVAVLGDSRAFNHLGGNGRDLSSRGPVAWAVNQLSGRASLDYRDIFGIGGTQIAVDNGSGLSARSRLPSLLAASSAPIIVIISDLNDIAAGRTAAQMATDMQGLCSDVIAAGRIPLVLGCVITQYSTTSTARTLVAEYNRRMRMYSDATRRMIWVDALTAVTDFASATTAAVAPGSGASAYYFDAIHYGPRAAEAIGRAIAAALDPYLPAAPWLGMWDAEDAYHATDRPFGSLIGVAGRLALSGGALKDAGNTASSAATGTCANLCRLYKDAGQSISVVGSLVSETITHAGRTFTVPAQRIQISAGGTGVQTAHLQLPDITASQVAGGESYVLSSYIRVANSTGLYSVNLQTRERGAASEQVQQCGNMTATTNAGVWSYWEDTVRPGTWIKTSKLTASPLWYRAQNFVDIQVDGALANIDMYVAQVVARKVT